VKQADKDLPPHVGYAQAMVRSLTRKYGKYESIPDTMKPAYNQATDLLRQYRAMSAGPQREEPAHLFQGQPISLPVQEGGLLTEGWSPGLL